MAEVKEFKLHVDHSGSLEVNLGKCHMHVNVNEAYGGDEHGESMLLDINQARALRDWLTEVLDA